MPEAEWRDAWKRYFKVSRLTRQIVVVPSWESYTPSPGDVPIALDPGMAFGTGTHASTQLVLEELQALADGGLRPARVLDMGCGWGSCDRGREAVAERDPPRDRQRSDRDHRDRRKRGGQRRR